MFTTIALLVSFSAPVGSIACRREDISKLRPCGNPDEYRKLTGGRMLFFKRYDSVCIGYSKDLTLSKMSWSVARTHCRSMGGDLADFSNNTLFDEVKGRFGGNYLNWIGGRRWRPGGSYYWLDESRNKRVTSKRNAWVANDRKHGDCISASSRRFQSALCDFKADFVCHLLESDYHATSLYIISHSKERDFFIVGEKLTVSCSSRSQEGMKLTISTENGESHSLDSDTRIIGDLKSIQVYDHVISGPRYRFVGARCFALYDMGIQLNANADLNRSTFQCCGKDGYACDKKVFTIKYAPQKPHVLIYFQKQTQQSGNQVTYLCVAKMGAGERMTIALVHNGTFWGRTYNMDGEQVDKGTRPPWFDQLNFVRVPRINEWWGGNHINLTLTFITLASMEGANIACYSTDVLEKVENKTIQEKDQNSHWVTLKITNALRKPHLVFYRLPKMAQNGKIPLYGCDAMTVSCIGRTGFKNGTLTFRIKGRSGREIGFWDNKGRKSLLFPRWIDIQSVREFDDHRFGPTIALQLIMTVTPSMVKANFECSASSGKEVLHHTRKLPFELHLGSLPPNLTSIDYEDQHETIYLEAKCSCQVGSSDAHTWSLLDYYGNKFYWFVNRSGTVHGTKKVAWIKVEFIRATWKKGCGQIINSTLKVLKRTVKEGATFTCYAFNVKSNFSSRFTKAELSVSFDIFGGGRPREIESLVLFWSIFLFMLLLLASSIGYLAWLYPPYWICATVKRKTRGDHEDGAVSDHVDDIDNTTLDDTNVVSDTLVDDNEDKEKSVVESNFGGTDTISGEN